ncbi:MAG TPA: hypothetical protein VGQ00_02880 [Candidatus Norongarragalinales archaeon]|jgi:hypothetical protein|nr:hypothetical protein [Candidatus Norongarragalinales archaeon]
MTRKSKLRDWDVFRSELRPFLKFDDKTREVLLAEKKDIVKKLPEMYHAIELHGGMEAVRKKLGAVPGNPLANWDFYKKEIETYIKRNPVSGEPVYLPSQKHFLKIGRHDIVHATVHIWGGFPAVRKKLKLPGVFEAKKLTEPSASKWKNWEYLQQKLRPLVRNDPKTGKPFLPSRAYFSKKAGYMLRMMDEHWGGLNGVRKKMGLAPQNTEKGPLADWQKFKKEILKHIGRNPKTGEVSVLPGRKYFIKMGRRDIAIAADRHWGGFPSIRRKLGLTVPSRSKKLM